MKKLNFISGLPRSGSTLLSAILKQNPRFNQLAVKKRIKINGGANVAMRDNNGVNTRNIVETVLSREDFDLVRKDSTFRQLFANGLITFSKSGEKKEKVLRIKRITKLILYDKKN